LEIFLFIASVRGAFSASTKLCARVVTSMPEPLPSLLIIPALVLAALALLVELVLVLLVLELEVLVVALDPAVEVEVDDTEVTMVFLYFSGIGIKLNNLSRN